MASDAGGTVPKDDECTFCRVAETNQPTADYIAMLGLNETDILPPQHRSVGTFLVLAEIAPITAGHLLIIPRTHVLAMAMLPDNGLHEGRLLRRSLGRHLAHYFGTESWIAFEHGTTAEASRLPRRIKCAPTEHAHLHILANVFGIDTLRDLHTQSATEGYQPATHADRDYRSLRRFLTSPDVAYHLFVQESEITEQSLVIASSSGNPPSQYFRRFLADRAPDGGTSEWNIRKDWRDEMLFATGEVLRDLRLGTRLLCSAPLLEPS